MRFLIQMSTKPILLVFWTFLLAFCGCNPPASNKTETPSKSAPKQTPVADMTDEQVMFRVRRLTDRNEMLEAIELLEERLATHPENSEMKQTLVTTKIRHGEAIARLGDLPAAAEIMKEVGVLGREMFSGNEEGASRVDYVAALLCEARAYAYEANVDACVAALQEAVEHGFGNLAVLKKDPFFGKLRSSSEYSQMVEQMLASNTKKAIREFTPVDFDFELEDLNGNAVRLSDSSGKIRIIDVWGTWCAPCLAELPSFIRLQNAYLDELKVIGVNVERAESPTEARQMVQAVVDGTGINYTCVIGNDQTTKTVPGFNAFPTILFVDRVGKARLRLDGTQSFDKLQSVVEYLITEGS
ncbi:TlpA family protein disulfide reductase [Planctomycetota bacterium]